MARPLFFFFSSAGECLDPRLCGPPPRDVRVLSRIQGPGHESGAVRAWHLVAPFARAIVCLLSYISRCLGLGVAIDALGRCFGEARFCAPITQLTRFGWFFFPGGSCDGYFGRSSATCARSEMDVRLLLHEAVFTMFVCNENVASVLFTRFGSFSSASQWTNQSSHREGDGFCLD